MIIQITIIIFLLSVYLTYIIYYAIPDICKTFLENKLENDNNNVYLYKNCIENKILAEQDFNYAEPEFIDAAIYEMKAADEKLQNIIKVNKLKF